MHQKTLGQYFNGQEEDYMVGQMEASKCYQEEMEEIRN